MECDFCGDTAQFVCEECLQGAWCSEECHRKDFADHEEHHCFIADDLSDDEVLEEIEHAVSDPDLAREMLQEHIHEELIGSKTSRMRRKRRRINRKRRKRDRKRRASKRERRRLKTAKKKNVRSKKKMAREKLKVAGATAGKAALAAGTTAVVL